MNLNRNSDIRKNGRRYRVAQEECNSVHIKLDNISEWQKWCLFEVYNQMFLFEVYNQIVKIRYFFLLERF